MSTGDKKWKGIIPPDGIGYRVRVVYQLMTRRFQANLDEYGITIAQYIILASLWHRQEAISISELTTNLYQLPGTMTDVLRTMEKSNLIVRKKDEQDKRSWQISLTPKGKQLEESLKAIAQKTRIDIFSCLTEEEEEALSEILDKLIAHLGSRPIPTDLG